MVIGIFGESCTGKSTIAAALTERLNATVYSGKDYVKLAKNETEARTLFTATLQEKAEAEDILVYVISEAEHLALLPPQAVRVLVTADLDVIKQRFAQRMKGNLPPPVAAMLEKKHGSFDREAHDLHIKNGETPVSDACDAIVTLLQTK